ncbi:MAG: O-antigen ligase family protein [Granulosicoccus sp.]
MASTDPLRSAKTHRSRSQTPAEGNASVRSAGIRQAGIRGKSRSALRKLRELPGEPGLTSGWPSFDGLKPVLTFLAVPACLVMAITLTGGHWPPAMLYAIAIALGLVVAASTLHSVELVLAILLIYLPFSKIFVIPIAPGINGTNMLLILGLFASVLKMLATRQKLTDFPAGAYLVFAFGFLTSLSAITIMLNPGGRVFLLYGEFLSYKAWVDQFLFFFIVLICVRDVETAKRCIVYLMIGSVLVVVYSVPEMLEKGGRSTIEKSRIEGPHLQSNNFGGFVAYTFLPLLALFLVYIKDIRAWLLTPYFLLTAKVLITTFSRGAYVAMLIGALFAGWFKGRGFLALWIAIALSFFLVFPSQIPGSVVARMDTFTENSNSAATAEDRLDQSSATRLIMWRAAMVMMAEDPVWGKGFKGFEFLKDDYVFIDVAESDPHSMYFYIGSQMGLPSLSLFLVILGYSFWLGRALSQNKKDKFIRVIGIGGASATACFAVACVFGSRAVSLNFTVYFWTLLVVMQLIWEKQRVAVAARHSRPKRIFARDLAGSPKAEVVANSGPEAAHPENLSESTDSEQSTLPLLEGQVPSKRPRSRHRKKRRTAARVPSRGAAYHQAGTLAQDREPGIERSGKERIARVDPGIELPATARDGRGRTGKHRS